MGQQYPSYSLNAFFSHQSICITRKARDDEDSVFLASKDIKNTF
jgi:hypothetical protein